MPGSQHEAAGAEDQGEQGRDWGARVERRLSDRL